MNRDDELEENDGDDDLPELEDDADDLTAPCPYCGEEIYDDAEHCPQCGRYLSDEDAPPKPKPWWVVAGAIVGLYVVLRWVVG